MSSLLSGLLKYAGRTIQQKSLLQPINILPSLPSTNGVAAPSVNSPWSIGFVRTIVRNNFPKARESKRVKSLGWKARLSTKNGRRTIMRRILRGRWYLTH